MRYEDLNGHFKERIRERVGAKIAATTSDPTVRDYVVGVVILLADENNLVKAAERLYEMKQANPATACTHDDALLMVARVLEQFDGEVSILHDLYQMQEAKADIMDIIAHMELRLLEP
jgi:hypothetical protein